MIRPLNNIKYFTSGLLSLKPAMSEHLYIRALRYEASKINHWFKIDFESFDKQVIFELAEAVCERVFTAVQQGLRSISAQRLVSGVPCCSWHSFFLGIFAEIVYLQTANWQADLNRLHVIIWYYALNVHQLRRVLTGVV